LAANKQIRLSGSGSCTVFCCPDWCWDMPMRWQAVFLAIPFVLWCSGPAGAKARFYPLAGVYGDLRQSAETDEITGTEIIIAGGPKGYFAFYQFWVGGAFAPVSVPIRYSGNKISFDVPASSGECRHFEGTISEKGFEGVCTMPRINGHAPIRQRIYLPRQAKSFWQ
jgi:hypothetical protein